MKSVITVTNYMWLLDVFCQEKPLDEALTFDDSHICKRKPTEITEFCLQSTESSELFRGVVDVDVTMVKATPSDPNNSTEQTSSHPIFVELTGRTVGVSQIQKENGHTQVLKNILSYILELFG